MEETYDLQLANPQIWDMAIRTVYKTFLDDLDTEAYQILPLQNSLQKEIPWDCLRLFRLEKITCNMGEDIFQKLSTVYYAAMSQGCSVLMMLDSADAGGPTNIYMGVRKPGDIEERSSLRLSYAALKEGLISNFPGSVITEISSSRQLPQLLDNIYQYTRCISSASTVATRRDNSYTEHKSFVQGIEKLVDTMHGKPYTAIFIAEPISPRQLQDVRRGYEELYSALYPYRKQVLTFSENESSSFTESMADSFSRAVTESVSHTQSFTKNKTENTGSSHGNTSSIGANMNIGIPHILSLGGNYTRGTSDSYSTGSSEGKSWSSAASSGKSQGETFGHTEGSTTGKSLGSGISQQLEGMNKTVDEMLKRIEAQLKRIQECERLGASSCGTFFISSRPEYSILAANTYRALMRGDNSDVESGAVNVWTQEEMGEHFTILRDYLRRFALPRFQRSGFTGNTVYRPENIVSGAELPLHMGLPTKSIMGLSVVDHAAFGRNVNINGHSADLGKLYHMGQVEEQMPISLNRNSLAAHTFITGSTGAGKTNTVCTLLNSLCLQSTFPTTFLVVEPAKGEYKNVFGGYPGVSVYGTNPKLTELLRLNPFAFPKEIHVLEHIDRLVEVFNACWPMYAAMPAVLKDAIEASYVSCGWSLTRSVNPLGSFPTFATLLKKLPEVMDSSAYSADTRGDYTGALVTRVKSLTNGINGQVFCADDSIPDEALFDRNVIVDLSRVGSMETKALVMGLLMIRLQEYRMSSAAEANAALRHVTVLEEAHNLLRRTSSEQSQDSSNLQGKSVEMLANAIAEMRTYGEGFIIADQAPGLLDMAVIRNTNTKIIMRLPDESDRQLVGKAAGLNDEQIAELAKLEQGVAAVYQNDWLEPVLCKVGLFHEEQPFLYRPPEDTFNSSMEHWIRWLTGKDAKAELSEDDVDHLRNWIENLHLERDAKDAMLQTLQTGTKLDWNDLGWAFYCAVHGKELLTRVQEMPNAGIAMAIADQQIRDQFQISNELAEELRKRIFQYGAEQVREDAQQYECLLEYGGIR